jgi:hypothetical protein
LHGQRCEFGLRLPARCASLNWVLRTQTRGLPRMSCCGRARKNRDTAHRIKVDSLVPERVGAHMASRVHEESSLASKIVLDGFGRQLNSRQRVVVRITVAFAERLAYARETL